VKLDPPLLTRGPLSGRIYVVTHGKVLEGGIVESSVKYDVTEQYESLKAEDANAA
jgi:hypothetical protein